MIFDDVTPFFHTDTTEVVVVNGVSVQAIFGDDYAAAMHAGGGVSYAASRPLCILPTASVPADPVGMAVQARGVAYVISAHEPNGTGISTLILEKA